MAAGLKGLAPADLLIADEAHRVAGPEGKDFQRVIEGTSLRSQPIPSRRRIFLTATPRVVRPQYRLRSARQGVPLASMDDAALFGPRFHTLSFRRAIEAGLLVDYTVHVLLVHEGDVLRLMRERRFVTATELTSLRLDAEMLGQAVALERLVRDGLVRKAFTFHHSKARARGFVQLLASLAPPEMGLFTGVVTGEQSAAERERVLREGMAPAAVAVVASARALLEGVDAPVVDTVVFADPRTSVIDIAQAVGRALRRDRGTPEKRARIVVPLLVREGEDPEVVVQGSAWEPVYRVVEALQLHDEALAEHLAGAQGARRERPDTGLSVWEQDAFLREHLVVDAPDGVPLERFRQAIRVAVLDHSAKRWETWYGLLRAFVEREGHACVPAENTWKASGHWVAG